MTNETQGPRQSAPVLTQSTGSTRSSQSDGAAHTPLPWEVVTDEFNDAQRPGICASVRCVRDGMYLAEIWSDFEAEDDSDVRVGCPPVGTGLANAALIVKAVNSHAELLAALKEIERLRLATDEGSLRVRADQMWDIARKAIARAEGRS